MGTLYNLDVGFNWNAPPVGTALANTRALNYRPLQWGLIDAASGLPAWVTQIKAEDKICFQVTDITQAPGSTPSTVGPTVLEWAPGTYEPIRSVTNVSIGF
ncbi:MAG: hypothetical protein AAGF23_26715, partial [Acidobacteriota bacterium]